MREPIATKDAPQAIGPYSQAVWVGDLLYCSGQIPLDPTTGNMVPGWYSANLWLGNGPWAATHFWLHYLYSQDRDFLRHRARDFVPVGIVASNSLSRSSWETIIAHFKPAILKLLLAEVMVIPTRRAFSEIARNG